MGKGLQWSMGFFHGRVWAEMTWKWEKKDPRKLGRFAQADRLKLSMAHNMPLTGFYRKRILFLSNKMQSSRLVK